MISAETWARAIDKRGHLGTGPNSEEGCAMDVWDELPGTDYEKYELLFKYYNKFSTRPSVDNDRFEGAVEERAAYMSSRIRQLS